MFNVGSAAVAKFLPNSLITTRGDSRSRTLYLTFDDGPDPTITPEICKLLARYDAKASFFCIGENIRKHPEIASQVLAEGHLLANHSDAHENYTKLELASQMEDLEKCQREISRLNPATGKIFRAPRGKLDVLSLYKMKRTGWAIVHWSYDSLDHRKDTLETQLNLLRNTPVQSGDIVLFHDDHRLAVDLLVNLLPEWSEQGFRFSTVAELL